MKLRSTLTATLLFLSAVLPLTYAEGWVGKTVPENKLEYFDNAAAYQGKPTILEFWATWCEPCKKLIPHLNDLQKKYQSKGLTVVGVSLDVKKSLVEDFRKSTPMNYTVAFDPDQKLAGEMKIEFVPYAFVLDRAGKIVWEGLSSDLKEETIESVLK